MHKRHVMVTMARYLPPAVAEGGAPAATVAVGVLATTPGAAGADLRVGVVGAELR